RRERALLAVPEHLCPDGSSNPGRAGPRSPGPCAHGSWFPLPLLQHTASASRPVQGGNRRLGVVLRNAGGMSPALRARPAGARALPGLLPLRRKTRVADAEFASRVAGGYP